MNIANSAIIKIFRNTAWLISAEIVNKGLLFFLTILTARYLGADGYGKFSFAISFVTIFGVLIDFGLNILTIREVSKNKGEASRYLGSITLIRIILTVITALIVGVTLLFIDKETVVYQLVLVLLLFIVLTKFNELFQGIFRAYEIMKFEAAAKIIQGIVLFAVTMIFIWQRMPLLYFAYAYVAGAGVTTLYNVLSIRSRFARFSFKIDLTFWKKTLREAWPFALSYAFISIYYHLDSIILAFIHSDQEVGWYNAAYKPIIFLIAVRNLYLGAIYPSLAKYYPKATDKIKEIFIINEKLAIIIGAGIAAGGVVLGPKIIDLLYGPAYQNSAIAFQILSLGAAVIFFDLLFPSFLNAIGRQKLYMKVVMVGAIINVIFNFLLIPKFHLIGAGIATVLAEIVVFALAYYFTNKIIRIKIAKLFIKPAIAAFLMGVFIFLLSSYLHVLLLTLLGFVVYLGLLFVLRAIPRDFIKKLQV